MKTNKTGKLRKRWVPSRPRGRGGDVPFPSYDQAQTNQGGAAISRLQAFAQSPLLLVLWLSLV